jgi:hypothetical protein
LDDREPIWSFGESQLLYDPTSALDVAWSFGESFLLDEYEEAAGGESIIPIVMQHYRRRRQ